MNRFETLCEYYLGKNVYETEQSFVNDKFATEQEKSAMKLILRNNLLTASLPELILAKKMVEYFIIYLHWPINLF